MVAWIQDEPSGRRLEGHLLPAGLPSLPIRLVLPDEAGIIAAARVKAARSVALGDAFAIALAQSEEGSVITGDQEIRRCKLVPVDWVGR